MPKIWRDYLIACIGVIIIIGSMCMALYFPSLNVIIEASTGILGVIILVGPFRRSAERVIAHAPSQVVKWVSTKNFWLYFLALVSFALILYSVFPYIKPLLSPAPTSVPSPLFRVPSCALPAATTSQNYISVASTSHGENIGISNGNFIFNRYDTYEIYNQQYADGGGIPLDVKNRAMALKQGATSEYISRRYSEAQTQWVRASGIIPNDAETQMYAENAHVMLDNVLNDVPYVDIVVGVTFSKNNAASSRDILQGAYVAQKEFNDSVRKGPKSAYSQFEVRLDIANSGDGHAKEVTCQILHAAGADHHIVGLMGWTLSQDTLDSMPLIDQAHFPMLAAASSSDQLASMSAYFARVNPSDTDQGQTGADYAVNQLEATKIVVLRDKSPYGISLANAFEKQSHQDAPHLLISEQTFQAGDKQDIGKQVQVALGKRPDLIYFAGYASDASIVFNTLPACIPLRIASTQCPLLLGGSALYRYGDYTDTSPFFKSGRIYFTAFAFADEWGRDPQHYPPVVKTFFEDFKRFFGENYASEKTYGYIRPEAEAMLAFDAIALMIDDIASAHGSRTPDSLHQQLTNRPSFQGVTGQIRFGADSNAQNKVVLVLSLDQSALTQKESCEGILEPDYNCSTS